MLTRVHLSWGCAYVQARGHQDILHALRTCMFDANGSMSEYELYFTWAWHMYRCARPAGGVPGA